MTRLLPRRAPSLTLHIDTIGDSPVPEILPAVNAPSFLSLSRSLPLTFLAPCVAKRQVPEPHGLLRPMFLSPRRYARLEEMYLRHQVATEVRG